ncbi:2768_t:CDS:2, partial [Paraglomus brasilianum]
LDKMEGIYGSVQGSISRLHPSFNNQTRLNYLIGKAKRAKYPFSQDIYDFDHLYDNVSITTTSTAKSMQASSVSKAPLRNAFIERYNKTLPFARVFTDVETANAYEHIFTEVFSVVENDTGRRLRFQHIDGEGIQNLVADAHKGQAK